jgi:hypothetical protein
LRSALIWAITQGMVEYVAKDMGQPIGPVLLCLAAEACNQTYLCITGGDVRREVVSHSVLRGC